MKWLIVLVGARGAVLLVAALIVGLALIAEHAAQRPGALAVCVEAVRKLSGL